MTTPNWQHHSRKDRKRKLKPQAIRSRRDARAALLRSLAPAPASDQKNNKGGSSARPFSIT